MRFVDMHVHLSDYGDEEPLLTYSHASETLLVAAGIDESTSESSLRMAASDPGSVKAFVGVHPSEADSATLEWLPKAAQIASGIGEVGLDPKYSGIGPGTAQMRTYQEQLEIAERFGLPVQVHTRDAEVSCLDVLSTLKLPSVLLHWFEGESLASLTASRGYYISFGPALLYSKKVRRIAESYPDELTLTESDGPVSFKAIGGAGGPYLIPSVVNGLAEAKGRSFEETRLSVSRNADRFLSARKG